MTLVVYSPVETDSTETDSTEIYSADIDSEPFASTDLNDPIMSGAENLGQVPTGVQLLLAGLALCVVSLPGLVTIPGWLHACWLGLVWGCITLASYRVTWNHGRLSALILLISLATLAHWNLQRTTTLDANSCRLIVLALVSGGWLIGLLEKPHFDQGVRTVSRTRWTIWDLVCLTSLVALATSIGPSIQNPFDLACQVAPSLLGGWIISLLAFEWAWRDRWTLATFVLAMLTAPLAGGITLLSAPGQPISLAALGWMISGPASIIATQGTLVLVFATALRLNRRSNLARASLA